MQKEESVEPTIGDVNLICKDFLLHVHNGWEEGDVCKKLTDGTYSGPDLWKDGEWTEGWN